MTKKIIISLVAVLLLSTLLASCDDSDPVAPKEDHAEAAGFVIKNTNGEVVFKELKGQAIADIASKFIVPMGVQPVGYSLEFLDEDGDTMEAPDSHHSLVFEIENEDIATVAVSDWTINITPKSLGTTKFRVVILHEDHPDFTSPYFDMVVE
jgi:hypothetical protein